MSSVKIAGVSFKQVTCNKSKKQASGHANSYRKKGRTARVIKAKNGKYCVFVGPNRKDKRYKKK